MDSVQPKVSALQYRVKKVRKGKFLIKFPGQPFRSSSVWADTRTGWRDGAGETIRGMTPVVTYIVGTLKSSQRPEELSCSEWALGVRRRPNRKGSSGGHGDHFRFIWVCWEAIWWFELSDTLWLLFCKGLFTLVSGWVCPGQESVGPWYMAVGLKRLAVGEEFFFF